MTRYARVPARPLAGLAALMLALGLMTGGLTANAALGTMTGYAYGERVTTTTILGTTVTSGPFPQAGPFGQTAAFSRSSTAASVTVPALLSTGTLTLQTAGDPATGVTGSSSVQTLNAITGTLTATAVGAQCAVSATGATTGSTTLVNAALAGVGALAANPPANTSVGFSTTLGGVVVAAAGTVTLNEQLSAAATNTLTVNAIHVRITSGTVLGAASSIDIIIAHVECGGTVAAAATPTPIATATPTPGPIATPTPTAAPSATPTPAPGPTATPAAGATAAPGADAPPASTVLTGPPGSTTSTSWILTGAATDNSALASVALYVRTPGASGYTLVETKPATGTSARLTFAPYSPTVAGTYAFYTIARDLAGHEEGVPAVADLTVVFVKVLPTTSTGAAGTGSPGLALIALGLGLLARSRSPRR